MPDDDIPLGEQAAFSATCDLIKKLKADTRLDPVDIGRGVLVAAVSCLRKELPNEEVAKLFYEVADHYATRGDDKDNGKVTRFPIKGYQRWRDRLGKRAVPCMITDRWFQFPEKSDNLKGGHVMFVDVMTKPDGENVRKLCQLSISKEDLLAALKEVD